MAVGYRSSSRTGQSDAFVTSVNIPVPSGAAANDIAVIALEQWESANPTVTYPTGFTQFINVVSGSQKLRAAWKRLTAGDTGNYTCSWTGSQWTIGECILATGCITSGSPVDASNTATATSTNVPTTTITATDLDFLINLVANENSATKTPATNFTEVQDSDYLETSYRIPGTSGSQSASGGTTSTSTLILAALAGLLPDSGAGSQTIVCNVLAADSTLFSPQIIQIVSTSVLNTTSTVFNPTVVNTGNISAPVLDAPSTVYSPTVVPGPVTVVLPVLNAPSTILNAGITTFTYINALTIDAPSTVNNPSIINLLQIINLATLAVASNIFSPSMSGGGSVPVAGSIADQARTNMLIDRGLSIPRLESNADLMSLVLADGAQTLITKTSASTGTHLLRYMMSLRS